jgi:hypothetical protein
VGSNPTGGTLRDLLDHASEQETFIDQLRCCPVVPGRDPGSPGGCAEYVPKFATQGRRLRRRGSAMPAPLGSRAPASGPRAAGWSGYPALPVEGRTSNTTRPGSGRRGPLLAPRGDGADLTPLHRRARRSSPTSLSRSADAFSDEVMVPSLPPARPSSGRPAQPDGLIGRTKGEADGTRAARGDESRPRAESKPTRPAVGGPIREGNTPC